MPHEAEVGQIVEVIAEAEQGLSVPYLCKADDGMLYYVKGQQTNRHSLWAEWICAHLASEMKLSVPPYRLLQVDPELMEEVPARLRNIGTCPAFGSQQRLNVAWLERAMVKDVAAATQQSVLAFDWWVRNMDRTVGNPNLLWGAEHGELVVIDHNQAFDPDFDVEAFLSMHIFADQWPSIVGDLVVRESLAARMRSALTTARGVCDSAPEDWLWENAERDVEARFSANLALDLLSRCETDELWRTQ